MLLGHKPLQRDLSQSCQLSMVNVIRLFIIKILSQISKAKVCEKLNPLENTNQSPFFTFLYTLFNKISIQCKVTNLFPFLPLCLSFLLHFRHFWVMTFLLVKLSPLKRWESFKTFVKKIFRVNVDVDSRF